MQELPSLEVVCTECGGKGCRRCEGYGVVPSEFGYAVLEFVSNYAERERQKAVNLSSAGR